MCTDPIFEKISGTWNLVILPKNKPAGLEWWKNQKFWYFPSKDFSDFLHNDSIGHSKNIDRARFSKNYFGPEIFGDLGDFGPKIEPLSKFVENGSNDFLDFLHNDAEQCL